MRYDDTQRLSPDAPLCRCFSHSHSGEPTHRRTRSPPATVLGGSLCNMHQVFVAEVVTAANVARRARDQPVHHFIDVGEHSLALEQMTGVLAQARVRITDQLAESRHRQCDKGRGFRERSMSADEDRSVCP